MIEKYTVKLSKLPSKTMENQTLPNTLPLILIWTMILIASPIGIIPWRTWATQEPYWVPWVHGIALLVLLSSTFIQPAFKPLLRFASIIVILFFTGYGGGWDWGLIPFIRSTEVWTRWMTEAPMPLYEITLHLLRLIPAMMILSFLLVTGRRRRHFFLVKGNTHAIVEQSRLISTKKPEPWIKVALIFTVIFATVTAVFLFGAYGIPWSAFTVNWRLFPIALLVATMNAFNEEFTLRAAPLGELEPTIGKSASLLATAAYFGLGHYYGVPNGVIGVLLSGFLGWFLGKSMLETKGFFVAWLVHFITDIPIFVFFIVGRI
jgi:hypothetical protein